MSLILYDNYTGYILCIWYIFNSLMMRHLVIVWMIILLLDFCGAQQCISNCPTGEYI